MHNGLNSLSVHAGRSDFSQALRNVFDKTKEGWNLHINAHASDLASHNLAASFNNIVTRVRCLIEIAEKLPHMPMIKRNERISSFQHLMPR
jgi:hypothetical protein